MKYTRQDFLTGLECILSDSTMRCVTVFCSPLDNVKQRIRITRKKGSPNELVITLGKPNYEEREFLKLCKKAKTKPRKVWFKFFKKKKDGR